MNDFSGNSQNKKFISELPEFHRQIQFGRIDVAITIVIVDDNRSAQYERHGPVTADHRNQTPFDEDLWKGIRLNKVFLRWSTDTCELNSNQIILNQATRVCY